MLWAETQDKKQRYKMSVTLQSTYLITAKQWLLLL